MPVQYYCNGCRKRLSISRKKIGESVACPVCSQETVIPPEDQESPPQDHEVSSGSHPQVTFAEAIEHSSNSSELPQESNTAVSIAPAENAFFQVDRETITEEQEDGFPIQREIRDDEDMDLTPMVDVTFLLLIFFMITASFSLEKTIPTPVPDPNEESSSQPIPQQEDLQLKSIVIEVTADNSILLDEEPLDDPTLLRDQLTTLMQQQQKAEALIKVADAAIQETVIYVLDTANEVGMQKIRLASRPEN
ncbi:MAG: biopolymer transporter ExbD [Planctomycetaceae bacterium]|nr:biopolymer transporter ExbD [Planctomycetaceae bacterium]